MILLKIKIKLFMKKLIVSAVVVNIVFIFLAYGLLWKIADGVHMNAYSSCWRDRKFALDSGIYSVEVIVAVNESCDRIRANWWYAPIFINPWNRS
jgi:hypothetical protein